MRDFSNVAEKDCVRLIIAQDLKEFGIDVDANLGGGLGNLTCISNTHNNNNYHGYHYLNNKNSSHHNHSLNHCTTNQHTFSLFSHQSNKHHNKSNISTNLMSDLNSNSSCACHLNRHQHDSQLSSSISPSTRVFGINLKQIEQINIQISDQLLAVPSFLKHAIDFINEFIHIEGIFRRNGTASRLKELKKQVEEGILNFSQFAIFDVTSLIKLFFRELPESLLTFALYSNFIQAVKLETTKSKLESILNLCLQLPDINLNVLIYLMNFLKRITQQESVNKMNSFNLAVCFAPNIIYTKINKVNDLYINEERIVVQLLIENSSMIGKISESVYERSIMLNSLCCSTTNNITTNNINGCIGSTTINDSQSVNNNTNQIANTTNGLSSNLNNDLFLYDNDENSSFAHHGQSAGSTSLSSYCGSSTSKKEKKKRRSSSLKELMNTIQNSISKFRRRSASEKNDKTTCSIITCSSMTNGVSIGGDLSCTSRLGYDDKQRFLNDVQTPFISSASNKKLLTTPICSSLYATPRINKRNAEDSLQSTTKKKLMEKLPQRNLLLPNAPITPFSTSKKSKHTFKQMLSTSEAASSISQSVSQNTNLTVTSQKLDIPKQTPQNLQSKTQTPATLTSSNVAVINGLHKQLKYDESPAIKINQTCDLGSLKSKYHHTEKNISIAAGEVNHECRRRLEMLPSSSRHHGSSAASTTSSCSSKSHHHHSHRHHHSNHGHYHHSSNQFKHSNHHHSHHHHYVNAIPSPNGNLASNSSSNYKYNSSSNRYINQSDLCTKIISGSYPIANKDDDNRLSFSSSSSSSNTSSTSETKQSTNQKYHNHTSACCGVESKTVSDKQKNCDMHQRSAIIAPGDNSMRCTLRRGRPNTPKTGLSVDYRIRKSSVPNTPECTNIKNLNNKVNHTISSNDDLRVKSNSIDFKKSLAKKSKSKTSVVVTLSSSSLNTAMVQQDDDDDKMSIAVPLNASNNDESRLLDMAFNEDDIDDSLSDESDSQESMLLKKKMNSKNRQLSLSLSNLPQLASADNNTTSISDNVLIKKSLSSELVLEPEVQETEQKRDNIARKDSINCAQGTDLAIISNYAEELKTESKIELPEHKQQQFIQFEPFKFKMPEAITDELKQNEIFGLEDDNMLQNVLRRQSLFKLKDKINGKVSKHINEIEKRKLSPYRFANSPLKPKKTKENNLLLSKIANLKHEIITEELDTSQRGSPVRVPSIFCKKNTEQFINRSKKSKLSTTIATSGLDVSTTYEPKIPSESPLIVRAKSQFYKKFTKNRSVKRLNATMNNFTTNLSSIADTSLESSKNMSTNTNDDSSTICKNVMNKSTNSPTSKHLIISTEWKCSTESIDL